MLLFFSVSLFKVPKLTKPRIIGQAIVEKGLPSTKGSSSGKRSSSADKNSLPVISDVVSEATGEKTKEKEKSKETSQKSAGNL